MSDIQTSDKKELVKRLTKAEKKAAKAKRKIALKKKASRTFTRIAWAIFWLLAAAFVIFNWVMAGYHFAKSDMELGWGDLIFGVATALVILAKYIDNLIDAKAGRAIMAAHERDIDRKLDEARTAVLQAVVDTKIQMAENTELPQFLKDLLGGDDVIEDLHHEMLTDILQEVTKEVVYEAATKAHGSREAAKKAKWTPGSAEGAEIATRFQEQTGHKVEMKWDGNGWLVELDDSHDDHDHNPGRSAAHDAARKRGDKAREATHTNPKLDDEVAAAAKRSERAKKAAATRKKNLAAKGKKSSKRG